MMLKDAVKEIHHCYAYPCKEKPVKYFEVCDYDSKYFCQAFCKKHLFHAQGGSYIYTETNYDTWLIDAYPKWIQIIVNNVMTL